MSIVKDSLGGNVQYSETHSPTTNSNGLFSIQIGEGTASTGAFDNISWEQGGLFYHVEVDLQGGVNYVLNSFQSFTAVPYSKISEYSSYSKNGLPINGVKGDLIYNDGTDWRKLPRGNNGQILTICGDSLVWTNGICPN